MLTGTREERHAEVDAELQRLAASAHAHADRLEAAIGELEVLMAEFIGEVHKRYARTRPQLRVVIGDHDA